MEDALLVNLKKQVEIQNPLKTEAKKILKLFLDQPDLRSSVAMWLYC